MASVWLPLTLPRSPRVSCKLWSLLANGGARLVHDDDYRTELNVPPIHPPLRMQLNLIDNYNSTILRLWNVITLFPDTNSTSSACNMERTLPRTTQLPIISAPNIIRLPIVLHCGWHYYYVETISVNRLETSLYLIFIFPAIEEPSTEESSCLSDHVYAIIILRPSDCPWLPY